MIAGWRRPASYDRPLFVIMLLLLGLSVVLISSASVMESYTRYGAEFYLTKKHALNVGLGLLCAVAAGAVSPQLWERHALPVLLGVFVLLGLVLVIGREINGARRWLDVGFYHLQPAELLKPAWICYLASYTARKIEEVHTRYKGFFKPFVFILIVSGLLLQQPDLGSLIVITAIMLGILWTGGAGLFKFLLTLAGVAAVFALLIYLQPYRMRRVLSVLDPWGDEFGAGYQLTQSLMAFGRGGLTGVGLGNSLQKLGYLPEAHTDFAIAVFGEEFGFLGMCAVLGLEFMIVLKALRLGFKILRQGAFFAGYVACGIGVWFCVQTTINVGMAAGVMPSKGLTLPLVSYGGSSMLVCCAAMGMLLRIDFEQRRGRYVAAPSAL